jgi:predicted dehydrogenase
VIGWDPCRSAPEGVRAVATLDEALEAADAVIVASPTAFHASQAIASLNAGRHVLVEKPLATNAAEAHSIVKAAAGAGLVAGVAMNLRFDPGIILLRRLVLDGSLGKPLIARASYGHDLRLWRQGTDYRSSYSARSDLGGGILRDAIHELDYLLWIFGAAATVNGKLERKSALDIDVEDTAAAIIDFVNGTLGCVDLNFFERAYRRTCSIAGTEASAEWNAVAQSVVIRRHGVEDELLGYAHEKVEPYRAELRDFLEAVSAGVLPRAPLAAGLAAVELADAIRASSTERQTVEVGMGS